MEKFKRGRYPSLHLSKKEDSIKDIESVVKFDTFKI